MWSIRRERGLWGALSLACLVASCSAETDRPRSIDPLPAAFSAANLDINRPCTLLTADDAADISGLPFYRTIAANLIEADHTRCVQGVGAYGLHGVVEIDVEEVAAGVSAREKFNRLCRIAPGEPPAPPVPVPPALYEGRDGFGEAQIDPTALTPEPASLPTPVINGVHCELAGGAYALLLPDRLVSLRVRESAGEIDVAATRRLASLISFRLTSN